MAAIGIVCASDEGNKMNNVPDGQKKTQNNKFAACSKQDITDSLQVCANILYEQGVIELEKSKHFSKKAMLLGKKMAECLIEMLRTFRLEEETEDEPMVTLPFPLPLPMVQCMLPEETLKSDEPVECTENSEDDTATSKSLVATRETGDSRVLPKMEEVFIKQEPEEMAFMEECTSHGFVGEHDIFDGSPDSAQDEIDELFDGPSVKHESAEPRSKRRRTEPLLPPNSKDKYMAVYRKFMEWRSKKNLTSLAEEVMFEFFDEQTKTFKPPTVWAQYSMLRSTLIVNDQIDISTYSTVISLLKTFSKGYKPRKSKVLSPGHIKKFLTEAPDCRYLATKVALIFGVQGACGRDELTKITVKDVENHGRLILVNIRGTKTKPTRSFVIDGEYCNIVKQYKDLRSPRAICNRFFLNFQNGKCTSQPIGKNKFSNMPRQIAEHLKLPDAKFYTGHAFRRTSATLMSASRSSMAQTLDEEQFP